MKPPRESEASQQRETLRYKSKQTGRKHLCPSLSSASFLQFPNDCLFLLSFTIYSQSLPKRTLTVHTLAFEHRDAVLRLFQGGGAVQSSQSYKRRNFSK